nr:hypothetical protein [Candidatus Omnitrophota bacterium]
KSVATVSYELIRRLERVLMDGRVREVLVYLNPDVAYHVMSPEKNMIRPFERRFRKVIRVVDDPNLHIEEIKIEERAA